MSLLDQLVADMKLAMKSKDQLRLNTIRLLRSQLKNSEIDKGEALTDEEVLQVLMSAAKRRRDTIEQFVSLGQQARAEEEQLELQVIEAYLPAQLSEAKIGDIVTAVIAELQVASMKDMGRVMGAVMPRLKGKADGKLVQKVVREKLTAG